MAFVSLELPVPSTVASSHSQLFFSFVHSRYISTDNQKIVGGILVGTGLWVTIIMIMRNVLKALLSWHGWMGERHGSVSRTSRLWLVRLNVHLHSKHKF